METTTSKTPRERPFRPMLAATLALVDETSVAGLSLPLFGSAKLDGIRGVIVGGELLSRKLIKIPNIHTQAYFGNPSLNGLDGELILGNPTASDVYRATDSAISTIEGTPDVTFYVFDWIGPGTYEERLVKATQIIEESGLKNIALLPQVKLGSYREILAFEDRMVKLGYEGIILRSPDSPYKYGRSTLGQGYLLKVKRFSDDEAEIIGFNQRFTNGNVATKDKLGFTKRSSSKKNKIPLDTLGSLIVRTREGVVFSIKGCIDDDLALEIWKNKDRYLGKWIKFKYFSIGMKNLPRFPVFLGFRSVEFDS